MEAGPIGPFDWDQDTLDRSPLRKNWVSSDESAKSIADEEELALDNNNVDEEDKVDEVQEEDAEEQEQGKVEEDSADADMEGETLEETDDTLEAHDPVNDEVDTKAQQQVSDEGPDPSSPESARPSAIDDPNAETEGENSNGEAGVQEDEPDNESINIEAQRADFIIADNEEVETDEDGVGADDTPATKGEERSPTPSPPATVPTTTPKAAPRRKARSRPAYPRSRRTRPKTAPSGAAATKKGKASKSSTTKKPAATKRAEAKAAKPEPTCRTDPRSYVKAEKIKLVKQDMTKGGKGKVIKA